MGEQLAAHDAQVLHWTEEYHSPHARGGDGGLPCESCIHALGDPPLRVYQGRRVVPHAVIPTAPFSVPGATPGAYLGMLFLAAGCYSPMHRRNLYKNHKAKLENMAACLEVAQIPPAAWLKAARNLWGHTRRSLQMPMPINYLCSIKAFNKHNMWVSNRVKDICPPRIIFPQASRDYWGSLLSGQEDLLLLAEAEEASAKMQGEIDIRVAAGGFLW